MLQGNEEVQQQLQAAQQQAEQLQQQLQEQQQATERLQAVEEVLTLPNCKTHCICLPPVIVPLYAQHQTAPALFSPDLGS